MRFDASTRRDTTKAILENHLAFEPPLLHGILEALVYITRLRPFRTNGIDGWIGSNMKTGVNR